MPDPATRIVVYCDLGKISTFAVATLRQMGYLRTAALDGGLRAWREAGFPMATGTGISPGDVCDPGVLPAR